MQGAMNTTLAGEGEIEVLGGKGLGIAWAESKL